MKKRKPTTKKETPNKKPQDFFDRLAPSIIKFFTDHYICGNLYKSVWAIREYPHSTEEQAILRRLGEKGGVTLKVFCTPVNYSEQRKIIGNAARKNKLSLGQSHDVQDIMTAQSNLADVMNLIEQLHRDKEPLLHVSVFIELGAASFEELTELQSEIQLELTRSKIITDRLLLRQKEGFISVNPVGHNAFGEQFERVLPASSVANFYPFNYSGKTDECGFYLGRDRFGTNLIVDFDKRAEDKTNSNILILGNSGQGKSYLMKLIITNLRESGKTVVILDPEHEYRELTENLGGCFIDLMSGEYLINLLEPKLWNDDIPEDDDALAAFQSRSELSQHIAFLKDFFKSYKKELTETHIDTLEIMLESLYAEFGIFDETIAAKERSEFPTLSSLYDLIEKRIIQYPNEKNHLYPKHVLQELRLSLYSMCKGSDSKYFNGHTNITDSAFITFGVKNLLDANSGLKNAMLFNTLSYMSNMLLTGGNTAAAIDELYLFLSNITAVEYIRNLMKRVRKKNSSVILASQNLNDYFLPEIQEYTKPLFAIPTHQFLFNPGTVDSRFFIDALQLEESEYNIIRNPERGSCLFKCGNERYNLQVKAPGYKVSLFGSAGGS